MHPIDLSILIAYIAIVFGIGAYFFQRAKTSKSYFLADRSVGWVAVGASLCASNISIEHFIGLAGSGASSMRTDSRTPASSRITSSASVPSSCCSRCVRAHVASGSWC